MATKTPFSLTHRTSSQRAVVMLRTVRDGDPRRFSAVVTRISPKSIRLALDETPPAELSDLFAWNREAPIGLELPTPDKTIWTKGVLTALVSSYEWDEAPLSLDFDFPPLSPEEAATLRETNPALIT